jgi:hypothetical protein
MSLFSSVMRSLIGSTGPFFFFNDACIDSHPVNFPDLSLDTEKSPEHG